MTDREIVAAKLADLGVHLPEEDLDELAEAYKTLLKWQGTVDSMLERDMEPAVTFSARLADLS